MSGRCHQVEDSGQALQNEGTGDCCPPLTSDSGLGLCPANHLAGTTVEWETVCAVTVGELPGRQRLWLCSDASCPVVYFGESGVVALVGQLRDLPAFKSPAAEGLLCFCYPCSRGTMSAAVASGRGQEIVERVEQKVRARACACRWRNPTGRCCLPTLKAHARASRAQPELSSSAAVLGAHDGS